MAPAAAPQLSPEVQEQRVAFGRALEFWMRKHGLSQQIPHDWAKANDQQGPWNSQISTITRGLLDPKATFWQSLGAWNMAIQDSNPGPVSLRVKELMLAAEPFLADDNSPADALDFFAMFIGAHPIREEYLAGPLYTDTDAGVLSRRCRERFTAHLTAEMLTRKEAWAALVEHLDVPSPIQSRLQQVLIGEAQFTPEQLEHNFEAISQAFAAIGISL